MLNRLVQHPALYPLWQKREATQQLPPSLPQKNPPVSMAGKIGLLPSFTSAKGTATPVLAFSATPGAAEPDSEFKSAEIAL